MNVFYKSLVVVFIAGSAFSAHAASKAELLNACGQSDKMAGVISQMGQELKITDINSIMSMEQVGSITSADDVVQRAIKQQMTKEQAAKLIAQAKVARGIIGLVKPAMNRAVAAGRAKFGGNAVVENLALSGIGGAMDIITNVYDLALNVVEARASGVSLNKQQVDKMTAQLQTSLENFAVLKVRLGGLQTKIQNMTEAERANLSAEGTFLGNQVQVELCKGIVGLARK